jgi:hypothetical protein
MSGGKIVSYLRVSTAKQGRSGLGLEAQRSAVARYLNGGLWELLEEIVEIESGSRTDRPQLGKALSLCRLHDATLVIAKLDRLSRDAHFLLGLQRARVRFVAADMPAANQLVVGIMAVCADSVFPPSGRDRATCHRRGNRRTRTGVRGTPCLASGENLTLRTRRQQPLRVESGRLPWPTERSVGSRAKFEEGPTVHLGDTVSVGPKLHDKIRLIWPSDAGVRHL